MVEGLTELVRVLQAQHGDNAQKAGSSHWLFEVMTGDGRPQVVHLLHKAIEAEGRDVSRVVADRPSGSLLQRSNLEQLLRKNAELEIGALCVEDFRDEDNQLVTYLALRSSHLLSTTSFGECWNIIEEVARVANALERDLYAGDLP